MVCARHFFRFASNYEVSASALKVLLAGSCLLFFQALGANADPALMKHIVFRDCSPAIPPGSFGTLSKTLYLIGDRARVEKQLDSTQHLQGLVVCSGKDIYMINLVDKTGSHVIDPGPTYGFYMEFFPEEVSRADLKKFCVGNELEFMKANHVPLKTGATGEPDSYETTLDGYDLLVLVSPTTHEPTEVQVTNNKRVIAKIVYEQYEEIPENPALFVPPSDVTIHEAKKTPPQQPASDGT